MITLQRIVHFGALAALLSLPNAVQAATPLNLAAIPAEVSGQAFYGVDMGFFSKAGLDAKIQIMNGGLIADAIVSGATDIGLVDAVSLVTAHAKGLPLVCIAPGASSTTNAPAFGIVYKADAPIKEAKDLDGLTFGVSGLNNIASLPTKAWIDQNGGDSRSIKWIEIPYPVLVPSLTRGVIAAALLTEPWITTATDAGYKVLYPTKNAIAPAFLASCWATTRDWVQKNAATARTFANQALAISRWANANQTAAAPILAKYLNVSPESVLRTHRYVFSDAIDPATLQPLIDTAAKYGIIAKTFPASDVLLGGK